MHPIESIIQKPAEAVAERLKEKFGRPFAVFYRVKPTGPILFCQDLGTKKVFKLRTEEFRDCGDPIQRVIDRIISRIQREEYDNGPRPEARSRQFRDRFDPASRLILPR